MSVSHAGIRYTDIPGTYQDMPRHVYVCLDTFTPYTLHASPPLPTHITAPKHNCTHLLPAASQACLPRHIYTIYITHAPTPPTHITTPKHSCLHLLPAASQACLPRHIYTIYITRVPTPSTHITTPKHSCTHLLPAAAHQTHH